MAKADYQEIIAEYKEQVRVLKEQNSELMDAGKAKDAALKRALQKLEYTTDDLEKLVALPGVGRKTANCVLVYAYEIPAIPVDIHVHRISNRLGLVKTKTPEETEFALMEKIPKKYWLDVNDTFVMYGQNICKPISPMCEVCKIRNGCKYYKTNSAS